ncbi:MAG: peptide chain release factor N(5)-glutamine methyltransferase [Planctomycetes bacterium HGW-Planctomycetes-1]|nr:MAG: peptide chain release factor N(5)-glutamine methyltransferase [Planctomycetes bacterium HGW-Planctomycetes-1]
MAQVWTIQKLLDWMVGRFTEEKIDSPRLSAELILSSVLQMERIQLYTHFDKEVEKPQLGKLHELVKRCLQNEPVQYLTGKCEFYSLSLKVAPACLIPRPETELLVERAIEFLRGRAGKQYVCDLCTGCGCVAAAIAKNFPEAKVIATDICDKALSIAAENIKKHNLSERVELLQGDLFAPIISRLDVKEFDLIVCNPPYVSAAEYEKLDAKVKNYEPKTALDGGADGLDVYRRIAAQTGGYLKKDGALILEIGYLQGQAVKKLLEESNCFSPIKIEKDFSNNDRIVTAVKS